MSPKAETSLHRGHFGLLTSYPIQDPPWGWDVYLQTGSVCLHMSEVWANWGHPLGPCPAKATTGPLMGH